MHDKRMVMKSSNTVQTKLILSYIKICSTVTNGLVECASYIVSRKVKAHRRCLLFENKSLSFPSNENKKYFVITWEKKSYATFAEITCFIVKV